MKYPFMYYITRVTKKLEALFPLSVIHAIQGGTEKHAYIISHLLKGRAPGLWEGQHVSSQLLLNGLYSCLGSVKTSHIYR